MTIQVHVVDQTNPIRLYDAAVKGHFGDALPGVDALRRFFGDCMERESVVPFGDTIINFSHVTHVSVRS